MASLRDFLHVVTPEAWLDWAVSDLSTLLIDHANCEKKAASTALALMFRPQLEPLELHRLSRLAREELRHYEQVLDLLTGRGIRLKPLSPSRYAGGLRDAVSPNEPERLLDTLLVSALVEARSCERFAALAPRLPEDLSEFYRRLLASEARHFESYLTAARRLADDAALRVDERLAMLLDREAELILTPDRELRFHSGPPAID
ncbi:MAG: tRNA-(ms[2]io[6]A)-hydroxylase [Pseudomonadota bacterium]